MNNTTTTKAAREDKATKAMTGLLVALLSHDLRNTHRECAMVGGKAPARSSVRELREICERVIRDCAETCYGAAVATDLRAALAAFPYRF